MGAQATIEALGSQEWLEPVANTLEQAVGGAYAALGPGRRGVKNFLHGVWLGHPLHPVLTDVPTGAWTVALGLDALEAISGRDELGPGADAAIALGLAGGMAAALAGLTDWKETAGPARRVGAAHGLLNVAASALYSASLVSRRRGHRDAGRGYAALGFVVMCASAYLGGDLVFQQRIGVDHAAEVNPPEDWVAVYQSANLLENQPHCVEVDGMRVLLVRRGHDVFALNEVCTHLGGPLSEGRFEGDAIVCPWHGSRFAIADGHVLDGPATFPEPALETRIRNGQVEVRARPR